MSVSWLSGIDPKGQGLIIVMLLIDAKTAESSFAPYDPCTSANKRLLSMAVLQTTILRIVYFNIE